MPYNVGRKNPYFSPQETSSTHETPKYVAQLLIDANSAVIEALEKEWCSELDQFMAFNFLGGLACTFPIYMAFSLFIHYSDRYNMLHATGIYYGWTVYYIFGILYWTRSSFVSPLVTKSVREGIGSGLLFPGSRTTTVSQPTITAATGTKPHSEDLILDIPNLVATARSSAREHIESVWSDTWLITPLFPAFIPLIVVIGCCCEIFGRAGLMSLSAQVNYYGYGQCLREDQQDLASKVRDEGWVGYMILFLLVLSLIATVFMAIHQSGKISGMVLRKSRKQIAISIAEAVQPLRIG